MTSLRFYLDSADLGTARTWLGTGLFHGVTTNPTILARAGLRCDLGTVERLVGELHALGAREVQVQAWGESAGRLRSCADEVRRLAEVARANVVIKLPATLAGTTVAADLAVGGQAVTLTAVYTAHQALLGALAGAAYVAPYLGRMNDAGLDGRGEIGRMVRALGVQGAGTQILAASLRNVEDIMALAELGVPCFTMSAAVAGQLFGHPLTERAAREFEDTAAGSPA